MLDDEPRLRGFLDHGPFFAFVKDAQARYLYVNPAMARAFGIDPAAVRDSADDAWLSEPLARAAREHDPRVLRTGDTVATVEAVPEPGGSTRHWMIVRFPFPQPDGSRGVGGIALDVTDLQSGAGRLAESERLYRHLVESAQGLICTHDMDGWLLTVNQAAQTSIGLSAGALIGTNLRDLLTDESRPLFNQYLERMVREGSAAGMMFVRAGNGRELAWKYHNVTVAEPGQAPYVLGHAQDVSELREAQERLTQLAMTDDLTGLHNRRGFLAYGAKMMGDAARHDKATAVLYVDIDGLKRVNDSFGHEAGTTLILAAADVLKNSFRAADVLARIGGDEFVALATVSQPDADIITNRLKWHLDKFNATAGLPYQLALSIGMAHMEPGSAKSLEDLVREADAIMYEQKRRLPRSR
jgi:diguanylate cyclase (GGDEF)-like protein/PAS domain S-box-containing protein